MVATAIAMSIMTLDLWLATFPTMSLQFTHLLLVALVFPLVTLLCSKTSAIGWPSISGGRRANGGRAKGAPSVAGESVAATESDVTGSIIDGRSVDQGGVSLAGLSINDMNKQPSLQPIRPSEALCGVWRTRALQSWSSRQWQHLRRQLSQHSRDPWCHPDRTFTMTMTLAVSPLLSPARSAVTTTE